MEEYKTRLAKPNKEDAIVVLDFYLDHVEDIRFEAIYEFFRTGNFRNNEMDVIITFKDSEIVGACSNIYQFIDKRKLAFSGIGLVHRAHRRKGISKILSNASFLRAQFHECDAIVKVRDINAPHINLKRLQDDGYTIKRSATSYVLEKKLK